MPKEQSDLPGMEQREIAELEEAAGEYKKIRNRRQKLTASEVDLKTTLLRLMRKHKKTDYVRDGIEIHVIVEKEKVRVTIRDEEEAKDEEAKKE